MFCFHFTGRPSPEVRWLINGIQVDDQYEHSSGDVIENRLLWPSVQRSDLNSIFTCQALNTKLVEPKETSFVLDMHCEYRNWIEKRRIELRISLILFIFHSSRFFLHQLKLVHIIFLSSSRRLPLGNFFVCLLFCFPFTRLHCFYVDKTFLSCKSYLGSQSVPLFFFRENDDVVKSREWRNDNGEHKQKQVYGKKYAEIY